MTMDAPVAPTLLMRTHPDLGALARWAAATGQRALREDPGYALHAALKATLGAAAPKPFALVQRADGCQFVGYVQAERAAAERALQLAADTDPGAAAALGLDRDDVVVKTMPADWRTGERLDFEARVAPIVRSRAAGADGGWAEVDAAFHPSFAGDTPGDRAAAHQRWLARELARDGAATLLHGHATGFRLAPIARRGAEASGQRTGRHTRNGLLPDLTVRGQLRVENPQAFSALLARGLGRHRSFGFGCLLLAPPGSWT